MFKFISIIISFLFVNLPIYSLNVSQTRIENRENEESQKFIQLSDWIFQLQEGLYKTAEIETIVIGGGSARAILDHLYDGKPLKMRDLDVFAIAGKEVTPEWLGEIGTHLETDEFGYFSEKDLRSRPRVPTNKPVLEGVYKVVA